MGDVGGVTLDGGTATFDAKDVGTAKTATLTGATLGGVDAGNYVLDSVATFWDGLESDRVSKVYT